MVEIYTDGSAKGNPGPGGFGVVMRFGNKEKEISQGFRLTTNNRMELLAVIVALESMKTTEHPIRVSSDSKYVIDSIVKGWVFNWEKKNFKGKKNEDLWKRYLVQHTRFKLEFRWIKGHAGHVDNERCDVLAVRGAESKNQQIDEWFESNAEK